MARSSPAPRSGSTAARTPDLPTTTTSGGVDDGQLSGRNCGRYRIPQRRTNQERSAMMPGNTFGIKTLRAPGRSLGVPLHTGLVPAALAGQHPRTAVAADDGHHRHIVEAVIGPDRRIERHHTEPAAWAAIFASTSFIHAS